MSTHLSPAARADTTVTGSAVPGTAVYQPSPGTYRVDPAASQITFTTRHLFGLGAVHGSLALSGGSLTIPDSAADQGAADQGAADQGAADQGVAVAVTVAAASIDTGSRARDRAVRTTRFLNTDTHPQITFTADQVVADRSGWRVPGELTVRGATAPVELTVTELTVTELGSDAADLTVRATARIDRYAHGLTAMRGLAARWVDLHITARASRG